MRARTLEMKVSFKEEKKQALKIAEELCYKPIIISQIQNATTTMQITRALREGRAM